MILIPGSFSFAKLVMMSPALAKSVRDARYVSQDPFIQSIIIVPYNLDSNLYQDCILSMLNAIKECGQEELLLTSILIVLSESRRIRRCCFLRCLAKIPNPPTDTPLLARSNCLKEKQSVSSMKIEIIYQKDKLSIKSINDSPKLQYTFIYFKATTVNKPSSSIIN